MARRDVVPLAAASAALVGWQGLVVPRLPAAERWRTPVHLSAAGLVLGLARARGHTWDDLGLDPARVPDGARHGAAAVAACAAAYGLALLLPTGRDGDLSLPDQELAELLEAVLVHVPVGTVLAEELVFRGALHAEAERVLRGVPARVWTASVFALWHLHPGLVEARRSARPAAHLAGTLAVTALGDVVMGWLRRRSGSLLGPAGLHLGTNDLGLVAAHLRARRTAA